MAEDTLHVDLVEYPTCSIPRVWALRITLFIASVSVALGGLYAPNSLDSHALVKVAAANLIEQDGVYNDISFYSDTPSTEADYAQSISQKADAASFEQGDLEQDSIQDEDLESSSSEVEDKQAEAESTEQGNTETTPPEQDGAAVAPFPLTQNDEGQTTRTQQQVDGVLYDWVSVDSYHQNPPDYNALGKFEDRWYAAHSFTEIGACIAALKEGDLLRVDGVCVQVSSVFYTTYDLSYAEARDIAGATSYCFQTCTNVGNGVRIAVCYPV